MKEKAKAKENIVYMYPHKFQKKKYLELAEKIKEMAEIDYVLRSRTVDIEEAEDYIDEFKRKVRRWRLKKYEVKFVAMGYSPMVSVLSLEAVKMGIDIVAFEKEFGEMKEVYIYHGNRNDYIKSIKEVK